ncbi:outer membrane beta-barrel protein [Sphingobacterium sp. HJSM2_6]|uniref:outer membrane beta-barrel protein n=1 Tax=Sphingobacterium sp. HJSM2_6 TaxID=3366264 RepID=UPI003BD4E438
MKKLLLTLTAVSAITFATQAQTEKGKFIVGGEVSFENKSYKNYDVETTSFGIVPSAGYFVADNIAIGTGIGYNWSDNISTSDNKITNNSFVVAPFGRLYSANQGPVKFFGQLSVPMAWGTEKRNDTKTGTTERYGVELAPGIAFFPTSNIGIDFKVRGLYFESNTSKTEGTDSKSTSKTYGLNASSFTPSVGVTFHF